MKPNDEEKIDIREGWRAERGQWFENTRLGFKLNTTY